LVKKFVGPDVTMLGINAFDGQRDEFICLSVHCAAFLATNRPSKKSTSREPFPFHLSKAACQTVSVTETQIFAFVPLPFGRPDPARAPPHCGFFAVFLFDTTLEYSSINIKVNKEYEQRSKTRKEGAGGEFTLRRNQHPQH
jgi:hypothetical protein